MRETLIAMRTNIYSLSGEMESHNFVSFQVMRICVIGCEQRLDTARLNGSLKPVSLRISK